MVVIPLTRVGIPANYGIVLPYPECRSDRAALRGSRQFFSN